MSVMAFITRAVCIVALVVPLFWYSVSREPGCSENLQLDRLTALFGNVECTIRIERRGNWWEAHGEDGAYQASIYYPDGKSSNSRTTSQVIIRIPGGPGDATNRVWESQYPYTAWLMNAADRCDVPIINLAYTGTRPNYSEEKPLIDNAIKDIEQLILNADKSYGRENVIIIAESLGSYLALLSSVPMKGRRILLVNPLIRSPKDWRSRRDGAVSVVRAKVPVRLMRAQDARWVTEFRNSEQMFNEFFDKAAEEYDRDLLQLAAREGSYSGLVIYDPNDRLRTKAAKDKLEAVGFRVVGISPLDHSLASNPFSLKVAFAHMDKFIDESCGAGLS